MLEPKSSFSGRAARRSINCHQRGAFFRNRTKIKAEKPGYTKNVPESNEWDWFWYRAKVIACMDYQSRSLRHSQDLSCGIKMLKRIIKIKSLILFKLL